MDLIKISEGDRELLEVEAFRVEPESIPRVPEGSKVRLRPLLGSYGLVGIRSGHIKLGDDGPVVARGYLDLLRRRDEIFGPPPAYIALVREDDRLEARGALLCLLLNAEHLMSVLDPGGDDSDHYLYGMRWGMRRARSALAFVPCTDD